MAHFKQVNPLEANPSDKTPKSIDWTLCVLCQKSTQETLQCPANSKRKDVGVGYKSLAENLLLFNELKMVPFAIGLDQLDDGSGVENTLLTNKAAWHKSCRDKVNSTKLKRAQKRSNQDTTSHSSVKTRRMSLGDETTLETESKCFFCNDVGGTAGLHQASTLEID